MFENSPEIQDIVRRVEDVGRLPLDLVPDPNLQVLSTVSAGSFTRGRHILRYRPNVPYVDYHVAHQAALLLRKLMLPAVLRANLARTEKALQQVTKDVEAQRGGVPSGALKAFAQQIADGLLRQLVSVPVGMRVDEWLNSEYPSLREHQIESIELQQKENLAVLSERVRAVTPPRVLQASVAMNAAHAIFSVRMGLAEQFVVPYDAVGATTLGRHLLSIYDDVPNTPHSDQQLVDKWGHTLKVSSWYEWHSVQETEIH